MQNINEEQILEIIKKGVSGENDECEDMINSLASLPRKLGFDDFVDHHIFEYILCYGQPEQLRFYRENFFYTPKKLADNAEHLKKEHIDLIMESEQSDNAKLITLNNMFLCQMVLSKNFETLTHIQDTIGLGKYAQKRILEVAFAHQDLETIHQLLPLCEQEHIGSLMGDYLKNIDGKTLAFICNNDCLGQHAYLVDCFFDPVALSYLIKNFDNHAAHLNTKVFFDIAMPRFHEKQELDLFLEEFVNVNFVDRDYDLVSSLVHAIAQVDKCYLPKCQDILQHSTPEIKSIADNLNLYYELQEDLPKNETKPLRVKI